MRRLGFAIAALVAGCYSPSYRDCEITCAAGSCPSGFVCDQGVCRVEGFSGACGAQPEDGGMDAEDPGDVDGDGVPNDSDNCKDKANANQANEDLDGYGDVCDPCPITPDPLLDNDSDGDGVGNGCDPNGNSPSAMITLFEGFAEDGMPSGAVSVPAGTWTFEGGAANGSASTNETALLAWPGATTKQTIRAQLTVTALSGSAQIVGAGVVLPYDEPSNSGIVCWIATFTGQTQLAIRQTTSTNAFSSLATTTQFLPGNHYELTFSRDGTEMTCADQAIGPISASVPLPALSGTKLGIFAAGSEVKFDWVLVVDEAP